MQELFKTLHLESTYHSEFSFPHISANLLTLDSSESFGVWFPCDLPCAHDCALMFWNFTGILSL